MLNERAVATGDPWRTARLRSVAYVARPRDVGADSTCGGSDVVGSICGTPSLIAGHRNGSDRCERHMHVLCGPERLEQGRRGSYVHAKVSPPQSTSIVRFTSHDGLNLEGDMRGDPEAPLVVLLHRGGQTRHAWASTAASLAFSDWRTLALDARGHGRSEWDDRGNYSLTAFARDVEAVIDQLERPHPVLIGASPGGMTSLLLEGELSPGFARAIALIDIAPRMEQSGASRGTCARPTMDVGAGIGIRGLSAAMDQANSPIFSEWRLVRERCRFPHCWSADV